MRRCSVLPERLDASIRRLPGLSDRRRPPSRALYVTCCNNDTDPSLCLACILIGCLTGLARWVLPRGGFRDPDNLIASTYGERKERRGGHDLLHDPRAGVLTRL